MRERRRTLAADDRRGLVNKIVVFEGLHHEEGEVHAARDVALEDGVAHVAAPHWQALAVALLEVAAAHDGPAGVAGEDALARLHLVVEVGDAGEACETAGAVPASGLEPRPVGTFLVPRRLLARTTKAALASGLRGLG